MSQESTISQVSTMSDDLIDRDDVPIRSKAAELIGRTTCVLWVYCNGKKDK